MYEELVERLREVEEMLRTVSFDEAKSLVAQAADAIEELSKPQNTVHLCTSCKYQYPECPADTGVVFGRGKGNDNICQCADYIAKMPRWIPVTEGFPKDRVPVQVCYIGMNTGTVESDLLACRYYGAWCYWDGEPCSYDECKVEITHWMPLTRPPKEEA